MEPVTQKPHILGEKNLPSLNYTRGIIKPKDGVKRNAKIFRKPSGCNSAAAKRGVPKKRPLSENRLNQSLIFLRVLQYGAGHRRKRGLKFRRNPVSHICDHPE